MHRTKGVVTKHAVKIEMHERQDRARHPATRTWDVKQLGERAFYEAERHKHAHRGDASGDDERTRKEREGPHSKSHDLRASEADHRAEGK